MAIFCSVVLKKKMKMWKVNRWRTPRDDNEIISHGPVNEWQTDWQMVEEQTIKMAGKRAKTGVIWRPLTLQIKGWPPSNFVWYISNVILLFLSYFILHITLHCRSCGRLSRDLHLLLFIIKMYRNLCRNAVENTLYNGHLNIWIYSCDCCASIGWSSGDRRQGSINEPLVYHILILYPDCCHCTVPKTFTRGYVALVVFLFDNVHCWINGNFHSQPIIC